MKTRAISLLIIFLVSLVGATFISPPKASAAFNANNIMSDNAFSFSNSMDAPLIDHFLNSFANSCISLNSGFEAVRPAGYTPSGGFTFGDYTSAGGVIATAAQAYGLNPQVLIVTLEKEQNLIRGRNDFNGYCNNGSESKYASAMGFACPDSGTVHNWSNVSLYRRHGVPRTNTGNTCVSSASKAGFSQQVVRAAWFLKFGQERSRGNVNWAVMQGSWDNSDDPLTCYSGLMTQGNHKRCQNGATVTYDGWTTIDNLSVHIDTGATAALYWYTPHFHGNQNFVALFEQWFGSTQTPATCTGTENHEPYVRRFYNPRTYQQFYSAFNCDIPFLEKLGYRNEGPSFNTSPSTAPYAVPIYRYYNPQTKLHIWTPSLETPEQLAAGGSGYQQEAGIVFYVARTDMPGVHHVQRFYNPNTYINLLVPLPTPQESHFLKTYGGFEPQPIIFSTQ